MDLKGEEQSKPKVSRKKNRIKNNKPMSQFFEKINKIDKYSVRLIKKKRCHRNNHEIIMNNYISINWKCKINE